MEENNSRLPIRQVAVSVFVPAMMKLRLDIVWTVYHLAVYM